MTKPAFIDATVPETDVAPLTARVGAEISNVRLSGNLPHTFVVAIKPASAPPQGRVLPRPGHLDYAEQERFAQRLGDLVPHPTQGPIVGTASILNLTQAAAAGAPISGTPALRSSTPIQNSRSCAAWSFRRLRVFLGCILLGAVIFMSDLITGER